MGHYSRLKVTQDAPVEVIRAAYRVLAAKYHPDRHVTDAPGGAEAHAEMSALNTAYQVLINPQTRKDYDALLADGEPVTWGNAAGRVLAARFINKDKVHDAVWFQEAGRKGAYYDLNGRSKTRSFLASPLAFSRVTSGFAMRFHPILQKWRAHLGVDFGAPTGTPVRTVGDGVVTFAGQQNGYGNVIQIQHSGNRMTVYAHLSRVDVRRGQHVEQGARIGAVGATGWATGPHLHFEFKLSGHQVDPMTIARASDSQVLSPQALAQFRQRTVDVAQSIQAAGQWQTAGAQSGPRFE